MFYESIQEVMLSVNDLPKDTGVSGTGLDTLLDHTEMLGTYSGMVWYANQKSPHFRLYLVYTEHNLGIMYHDAE